MREGERTSAQTQAVGEGQGIMLKGYQERIRRRDFEGGGRGSTGHVGKINLVVLQNGLT